MHSDGIANPFVHESLSERGYVGNGFFSRIGFKSSDNGKHLCERADGECDRTSKTDGIGCCAGIDNFPQSNEFCEPAEVRVDSAESGSGSLIVSVFRQITHFPGFFQMVDRIRAIQKELVPFFDEFLIPFFGKRYPVNWRSLLSHGITG